jgi:hypothetical protein
VAHFHGRLRKKTSFPIVAFVSFKVRQNTVTAIFAADFATHLANVYTFAKPTLFTIAKKSLV